MTVSKKRVRIAGLTTVRGCRQAALRIVSETSEPLVEATVDVVDVMPGQSLVEAIDPNELPGDGPLRVIEIDHGTTGVSYRLGNRQSAGEVIDEVRDRVDSITRRV